MDNTLIIILAIILIILVILNNITIVTTTNTTTQATCAQTTFGCCPNGVDSKINFYGTNCPGYRPVPGYPPTPQPAPSPNPPKPIGGCAGTRYGCCPNNYTPKTNAQGTNCN
jgi:hypothetical protein